MMPAEKAQMDPRTKFRDLISVGDLGSSRTATVTPRPPSDSDSNKGAAFFEPNETSASGQLAENGFSLRDDDVHPVHELASAPLSVSAATNGSPTGKGVATTDNNLIEGADAQSGKVDKHDPQRFDGAQVGDHGPAHTPAAIGASDAPSNDWTKSAPSNIVQQYGSQSVSIVDGGGARFVSPSDKGIETLNVIDIDFALYMPINIGIAVNSSTTKYTPFAVLYS